MVGRLGGSNESLYVFERTATLAECVCQSCHTRAALRRAGELLKRTQKWLTHSARPERLFVEFEERRQVAGQGIRIQRHLSYDGWGALGAAARIKIIQSQERQVALE